MFCTDAAPGIGQATALSFAREGCKKILLADRNATGLEETKTLIKEIYNDAAVEIIKTDMLQESQINAMVEHAVAKFGRVDYVLNAAGTSIREWNSTLRISKLI